VRRTAPFAEESLYQGTEWAVFEDDDERFERTSDSTAERSSKPPIAFRTALRGEVCFVECHGDATQNDMNLGIMNIHIGFAPLRPAEFVVIRIWQLSGQIRAAWNTEKRH
jgi:uncharacterized protein